MPQLGKSSVSSRISSLTELKTVDFVTPLVRSAPVWRVSLLISWRAVIHKVYWKSSPFFFNNGIESVIDRKEPVLFFSTLLSSSIIYSHMWRPPTALDQTP